MKIIIFFNYLNYLRFFKVCHGHLRVKIIVELSRYPYFTKCKVSVHTDTEWLFKNVKVYRTFHFKINSVVISDHIKKFKLDTRISFHSNCPPYVMHILKNILKVKKEVIDAALVPLSPGISELLQKREKAVIKLLTSQLNCWIFSHFTDSRKDCYWRQTQNKFSASRPCYQHVRDRNIMYIFVIE